MTSSASMSRSYAVRISAINGKVEQAEARKLKAEWESAKRMMEGGVKARNAWWRQVAAEREGRLNEFLEQWE